MKPWPNFWCRRMTSFNIQVTPPPLNTRTLLEMLIGRYVVVWHPCVIAFQYCQQPTERGVAIWHHKRSCHFSSAFTFTPTWICWRAPWKGAGLVQCGWCVCARMCKGQWKRHFLAPVWHSFTTRLPFEEHVMMWTHPLIVGCDRHIIGTNYLV